MFQTVGIGMFDTTVVKRFLKRMSAYLVGQKILLNNGETGEVAYIPLQNPAYPVVKVSSGYLDFMQEDKIEMIKII